jgi:hypothetical protein
VLKVPPGTQSDPTPNEAPHGKTDAHKGANVEEKPHADSAPKRRRRKRKKSQTQEKRKEEELMEPLVVLASGKI